MGTRNIRGSMICVEWLLPKWLFSHRDYAVSVYIIYDYCD